MVRDKEKPQHPDRPRQNKQPSPPAPPALNGRTPAFPGRSVLVFVKNLRSSSDFRAKADCRAARARSDHRISFASTMSFLAVTALSL